MKKKKWRKCTASLSLLFVVFLFLVSSSNNSSVKLERSLKDPYRIEDGSTITKFTDFSATTHGGRGDESVNGDGDELSRLQKRGGKDYSQGHRRIYASFINLIGGTETIAKAKILEVGTGIGYGLNLLLNDVDLNSYVGIEPCTKCLEHVKSKVVEPWLKKQREIKAGLSRKKQALFKFPEVALRNGFLGDFSTEEILSQLGSRADFSFCIEVVEHVDPDQRLNFLEGLRKLTEGTLFLSTPNKDTRPKDGALSSKQWLELLADAGFVRVTAIEWQWTTVFICQSY